jgi:transposase
MAKGVRTYTEAKAIQAWVMRKKKQRTKIVADTFNITTKSVSNWIRRVNNNKDLLARAQLASGSYSQIAKAALEQQIAKAAFEQSSLSDAKTATPVGEISEICLQHVNVHEQLTDENAFLRWWNFGERKGWVDRLLKELESK